MSTSTTDADVVIRALKMVDRPALLEVLSSDGTFADGEVAVALELIDDAITHVSEVDDPLAARDGDYWVRIAECDGQVAGYICYGPTPMTESTYDLYWIVTHQRARGRGVARALIGAMEADLGTRGVTGIRVETSVKESHGAARRLYASLQYPEQARFPNFYERGDDLIVYFKQF